MTVSVICSVSASCDAVGVRAGVVEFVTESVGVFEYESEMTTGVLVSDKDLDHTEAAPLMEADCDGGDRVIVPE